jgi:hypothetical protein
MQKLFEDKRAVLLAAFLALVSLVLLAGSLKSIDFRPGESFGRPDAVKLNGSVDLGEMITDAAKVPLWKQVLFWVTLFVIVLLIASLLDPQQRKKLILAFIRLALFVLVFLYIVENKPEIFAGFLSQLTLGGDLATDPQAAGAPLPVFQPPQVPNWLSYAVALGFVLLGALFLWWLNRLWGRIKVLISTPEPLDELAEIARQSIGELQSGGNFENSILECYARMSSVVDKRKGLHRENAMTPAEFAARLTRAGLPREPVEKLTRLFEAARYGRQPAGQTEIDQAVTSLSSILRYCGEQP